jgi:hypothetical protein
MRAGKEEGDARTAPGCGQIARCARNFGYANRYAQWRRINMKYFLSRYWFLIFTSLNAYALLVLSLFFDRKIEYVHALILGIALAPWLLTVVKSLEFPKGWRVELHDKFKDIGERARATGLLDTRPPARAQKHQYSFQQIAGDDPGLALAGLRIELEKRLREMAQAAEINVNNKGIGHLLRDQSMQRMLDGREQAVIRDLIGLLNQAVHAQSVDRDSAEWALSEGVQLLKSLDRKMPSRKQKGRK